MSAKSLLEEFALALTRAGRHVNEAFLDRDIPGISGLFMQASQMLKRDPARYTDAIDAAKYAVEALDGRSGRSLIRATKNLVSVVVEIVRIADAAAQVRLREYGLNAFLGAAIWVGGKRTTDGKLLVAAFEAQIDALIGIDREKALEVARQLEHGYDIWDVDHLMHNVVG